MTLKKIINFLKHYFFILYMFFVSLMPFVENDILYSFMNTFLDIIFVYFVVFQIQNNYKKFSLFSSILIYWLYIAITDKYITVITPLRSVLEFFIFSLILHYQNIKNYEISSDKISENVCLVFYHPKTFKQFLTSLPGFSVSSFGMIYDKKLYQLRWKHSTIQKLNYTKNYIYSRYVVVDTGVKYIKKEEIDKLLTKKARQWKTFWLRYNCLRCFKDILNKDFGIWEYKGEVFPSIYLKKRRKK